ncbi:hypothetical protein ROHU_003455 [Labeo rohita]|uniref:Uncharacterized protein n=1 Tax=Labeo rohita TaxID=84645 RepID=A0A498NWB8_LABRO|nr:hypothetical protein ROHU_003455 [Labeo rohita]
MHKKVVFFPGRVQVAFRKGPLGYLLQEPTDQARLIKDNTSLQDKSAPKKQELVRQYALLVVRQRGGDASDRIEVLGEYILQFGKYKGKCFRWLLENDIGYAIYLIKSLQQEEAAGDFMTEVTSSAQPVPSISSSFPGCVELRSETVSSRVQPVSLPSLSFPGCAEVRSETVTSSAQPVSSPSSSFPGCPETGKQSHIINTSSVLAMIIYVKG